ncbi:MAG TPA: hypothetical protein VF988_15450, partial [Verrucomicrobiae bacterium]
MQNAWSAPIRGASKDKAAVNHFVKDFWRKNPPKIALMVGKIMNRALHQRAEEVFCSAFEIESL